MLLNIFLHAFVLGIILLIVTKGQNRLEGSILLGLPIGLGILSGILFLLLGIFSLVISLGITVFSLRWAFDLSINQSLIVTGIWGAWQIVYAII